MGIWLVGIGWVTIVIIFIILTNINIIIFIFITVLNMIIILWSNFWARVSSCPLKLEPRWCRRVTWTSVYALLPHLLTLCILLCIINFVSHKVTWTSVCALLSHSLTVCNVYHSLAHRMHLHFVYHSHCIINFVSCSVTWTYVCAVFTLYILIMIV